MRQKENAAQWKCRVWRVENAEKEMRHKIAGVENAGKVACVIKLKQHKNTVQIHI